MLKHSVNIRFCIKLDKSETVEMLNEYSEAAINKLQFLGLKKEGYGNIKDDGRFSAFIQRLFRGNKTG